MRDAVSIARPDQWLAAWPYLLVSLFSLAIGCASGSSAPQSTTTDTGNDDPAFTSPTGAPGTDESCAAGAEWVYLLAVAPSGGAELIRFDPSGPSFNRVGAPDCPTSKADAGPYSMSVTASGEAWMHFDDSLFYRMSVSGGACTRIEDEPTTERFSQNLSYVGMSFAQRSGREVLYMLGGPTEAPAQTTPAAVDLETRSLTLLGQKAAFSGAPELTATATGRVFAFVSPAQGARIQELDPATLAPIKSWQLEGMPAHTPQVPGVFAWAFAHWGGALYMSWKPTNQSSSSIYRVTLETLDAATGGVSVSPVKTATGYTFVGAGVSICAPTELI